MQAKGNDANAASQPVAAGNGFSEVPLMISANNSSFQLAIKRLPTRAAVFYIKGTSKYSFF